MEIEASIKYLTEHWGELLVIWILALSMLILMFALRAQRKQDIQALKTYTPGDTIHYRLGKSIEVGKVHKVTDNHLEVLHGKLTRIVYLENIIH